MTIVHLPWHKQPIAPLAPNARPASLLSSPFISYPLYTSSFRYLNCLNSAIPTSRASRLHSVEHTSSPILDKVWQVLDGVGVWKCLPAAGTVAVVVEPGAEDEVSGGGHECAGMVC